MTSVKRSVRSALAPVRRQGDVAADYVRSAPGTFVYFFALLITSWSQRGLDSVLAQQLVQFQSTNLDNLADRPLQVLVLSAFWTTGGGGLWLLLRFVLVLAPVERRLGTRRWLLIFATAHVLATLATVTGISLGIGRGVTDPGLASVVDVGVSYGFYGVAGALTWLLPSSGRRLVWVGAALASILLFGFSEAAFTDVGHLLSLAIGLAFLPLIRRWQRRPLPRAALGGQPITVPHLPRRPGARDEEEATPTVPATARR